MHANRKVIESLANYLGLPLPDPFSQDWQYEVADPCKVREWLNAYESERLNREELALLMVMILASYNDALSCWLGSC